MANAVLGFYPMSIDQMSAWATLASSFSQKDTGRLLDVLDRTVTITPKGMKP